MLNKFKKICLGLPVLFLLFALFGINSANATVEGNLGNINCGEFSTDGIYYKAPIYSNYSAERGQAFRPLLSGTLNHITFKYLAWDIENLSNDLFVYVLNEQGQTLGVGTEDVNNPTMPQYSGCGSGANWTFNFSNITLQAGQNYRFYLGFTPTLYGTNTLIIPSLHSSQDFNSALNYNGTSSTYLIRDYDAQGNLYRDVSYNPATDFYFEVDYTGLPNESITIENPVDGDYFATPGDILFIGNFINANLRFTDGKITVWSAEGNSGRDFPLSVSVATSSSIFAMAITLPEGHYSAWPSLYTATSSLLGNVVNFNIATTSFATSSIIQKPTENQICNNIATSTFFGGIECGLKKVAVWAFYPDMTSINLFKNSYDNLKSAFPFSTFFGLTDAVNAGVNHASSTDESIGVPMIRNTATGTDFYILPVLASSSMANAIGQDNANLFRKSLGWLMWSAVGIMFFIQFKKF